jgi:hypothetical protein
VGTPSRYADEHRAGMQNPTTDLDDPMISG